MYEHAQIAPDSVDLGRLFRTLGGSAFEPLISGARNGRSFGGKESSEGEYLVTVLGVACGAVSWPDACRAGAPFEASPSGSQNGVGGRMVMGRHQECACATSGTVAQ